MLTGLRRVRASKQDTPALRRRALANKFPAVIFSWRRFSTPCPPCLTVYANRKSVKDHRNPNSLTIPFFFHYHLWTTKGSERTKETQNF